MKIMVQDVLTVLGTVLNYYTYKWNKPRIDSNPVTDVYPPEKKSLQIWEKKLFKNEVYDLATILWIEEE